ncbi:MAG: hypothetical protein HOP02_01800 [Methylococcaceae bacterium]|nr:hypothetical protein [Methylococcaceae bacterium]
MGSGYFAQKTLIIYTRYKARHSGIHAGMTVNYTCVDIYAKRHATLHANKTQAILIALNLFRQFFTG